MNKSISLRKHAQIFILAAALLFLIVCPLIMIFAKAVITDGRLGLNPAWQTLRESKNAILNIHSSLEEAGAMFGADFGQGTREVFTPLLSGNYENFVGSVWYRLTENGKTNLFSGDNTEDTLLFPVP